MLTKEEILEAIHRTTKKNGGAALGIARFEAETGIRETEWERYWPRFTDAQKEAGVTPNSFGIPGFPDEVIFEKFILLVREKGRIPVTGELKVKHTYDVTFPSVAVFQRFFRRFGGIQNFISELLKYAENNQYKDIVKLCGSRLESENTVESADDVLENQAFGYVYLGKRGKHYRIGRAKDIDQRRNDHNLNQPEYFEYIHVIKTDDPVNIEDYWHKRFASKILTGEWFYLTFPDVRAFKRWKRIF